MNNETPFDKRQKDRKNKNMAVYLPFMGLVIIISLAVLSYFLAPILDEQLTANLDTWETSTESMEEQQLNIMLAAAIWIILLAFMSFLGAVAYGGQASIEDEGQLLRPREGASAKEIKKYERGLKKIRKQKRREYKRLKKKKDALEAKWRREGKYDD